MAVDAASVRNTGPTADRGAFAVHEATALGTRLNLLINAESEAAALISAQGVRREIDRLGRILNWRDPTSELSRLNRAASHVASPDLFAVVTSAEAWRQRSESAYSGRLGRILALWRIAAQAAPDPVTAWRLASAADAASVGLDPATRTIVRPSSVQFDLDGLAKGYIVDKALAAAMSAPRVSGALLDIGGDIRCAGPALGGSDWLVGLPEPRDPFDNAPLIGRLALRDTAIATSGCGPRDRMIGPRRYSATLDPRTGWPVPHERSTTVIAPRAMDADALATALLNLPKDAGAALVRDTPGASARLTDQEGGAVWFLPAGRSSHAPVSWIPAQAKATARPSKGPKWPERWVAFVTFTAPPKQMKRDLAFRSPYVAIWVTDAENRPVRTLFLVGSIKEWQQDNYIWWSQNRANAVELVSARSFSTRGTGEYKVLWDGVDESGKKAPAGKYILHVETSQERGKHTHRTLELDTTEARPFTVQTPTSEESGSLVASFARF